MFFIMLNNYEAVPSTYTSTYLDLLPVDILCDICLKTG